MNDQIQSRMQGERCASMAMVLLLCGVSIWRTPMTRLLPLCGASTWWVMILCLLPGFTIAAVFRGLMYLTGAPTVTETVRVCLGKGCASAFSVLLAVGLLVEASSALTALITLFTQGVGTKGTQFTLAALTGVVLLFSLHREGLPRAVYLLRWGILAAGAVLAAFAVSDAHVDGIFPLHGSGDVLSILPKGVSMSWTVILLLTLPSGERPRLASGIIPAFGAAGTVLLTSLVIPHEVLVCCPSLADALLLPLRFAPNALRLLGLCLVMLCFYLGIGAALQLATTHLLTSCEREIIWLPRVLLVGLILTQCGDIPRLWTMLGQIESILLLPLAGLAVMLLPIAIIRRNQR